MATIWNAADVENVDLEQRNGTAAVRSAPSRDRAEAGFIEALDRNATGKAPDAINKTSRSA
jgi:hypothetical protein